MTSVVPYAKEGRPMIRRVAVAACLAGLVLGGAARAQDKTEVPKDMQEAAAKLKEHLGKLAQNGELVPLTAEPLAKTFPDYRFLALRFRIYPVARAMPEGMKPSNLFAVPKQGKPEAIKDAQGLEKFFREHAPAADSEATASALVRSWLSLSPEFFQDGFYKLEVGK